MADTTSLDPSGMDRLLGYLVRRLPEIRGEPMAWRTLFDALPVAVRIQDGDGITCDCNQAFCELLGYDRDVLIGCGPEVYVSTRAQLALARRTLRTELERHCQASVSLDLLRADGRRLEVISRLRALRLGDEVRVVGAYWPRAELLRALDSPKILSSASTESGSTAN